MKILLPAVPNYRVTYPPAIYPGGAEVFYYRLVRSLSEFDITLMFSRDAIVDAGVPQQIILGDYLSREATGKLDKVGYTEAVLDAAPRFDLVVLNDNFLSTSPELLERVLNELAPKTIVFQHDPDEIYLGGFHVTKFHLHALMAECGSRIAYVSQMLPERLEKASKYMSTNPYLIPGYECPTELPGGFNHFDINEVDAVIADGKPKLGNHWVISGRSATSKHLLFGIKSFLKTDEPEVQIYTRKTTDKTDDYAEIVQVCVGEPDRLKLFDNVPQSQLFQSLKCAKGFIFPSKRESCGLVAFEAFSAGCPVIYSVPDSNFFLQDWELNRLVPRRIVSGYANAITDVCVTQGEKERMWKHVKEKWSADAFRDRLVRTLGLG